MCYSKEVSLAAGSTILLTSYWFYVRFYLQQKILPGSKKIVQGLSSLAGSFTSTKSKGRFISSSPLKRFTFWFIMGYAAIGGHQIGEFLSIATGSELIYKLGLVSSIACTYLMLRAFESLSERRFGSWLALTVIGLVSIDIFRTPMVFENTHFWVRGLNHQVWAVAWLALWLYLLLVIGLLGFKSTDKANRRAYWFYGLGGINISFALSWLYAIVAHRFGSTCSLTTCSYHFLQDFNYRFDFPSLWCTFTVIQAPFIFLILRYVHQKYKLGDSFGGWYPSLVQKSLLVITTLILMFGWYHLTPLALGVSWKMLTK